MWWPFKRAAVPADDPMDWQPSTPPQTPKIYPDHYVPGGWPEALPTPKFVRGPDPDAFFPTAKRVCRGLGRAGALTASTTATVGVGVATYGARTVCFTAKFTAASTISIIRNLSRRRPREPRPRSRTGLPYERTAGYSSPKFLHIRTTNNPVSLAQEQENKHLRFYDMMEGRWPKRPMRPPPPRMSKPWKDSYKSNSMVVMPFENPRQSAEDRPQPQKDVVAPLAQTASYPNQRSKIGSRPYDTAVRKMRQKYMSRQLMSTGSPKQAQTVQEQSPNPDDSMIDDIPISEDGASPTQDHTKTETKTYVESTNKTVEMPSSPFNPFLSPKTPSTVPSATSNTTPRTPAEAGESQLLHTPSRITGQATTLQTSEAPSTPTSHRAESFPLRETETPSRPGTPETDISSNCDFTPEPKYGMLIPSADDAVGPPSSPSPKVAQNAPPSRILPSVVGKFTGTEDVETTVDDKDAEPDPPKTDQVARRTRSMQLRKKEDEPRSPQTNKNQIQTPGKTPKHGKTKSKVAVDIQEKRAKLRRSAEQWKIHGLSDLWLEKVEEAVKHGDKRTGLSAMDFARVAPFRTYGGSRENWLNDQTINEYLKIVAAHGEEHSDKPGTKTHHAFNSFFYTSLTDKKKGPKFLRRWSKKAGIGGKNLLETKFVLIPINSGAHWTLCAVSGINKTLTYYDSMNFDGKRKMKEVLEWVEAELEDDFVREEWQLVEGASGQQTNSDDCGVFTVTNARSIVLGDQPDRVFGPEKVRIQRERIVAEIVHGALLERGM